MRILLFIDSLGSGGAQRQMVELAKGFKDAGHCVGFCTYHELNFFKYELDDAGIEVSTIIENNYIKRIFKICKFIHKNNFDVILSFLTGPSFISEIAGFPCKKWKLIVGERSSNPLMISNLRYRIYRWFHFLSNHVVTNSNLNTEMVINHSPFLSRTKCHTIYNLVDLEKWKPDPTYLPFQNNKLNIVVASSHQYLKNLNGLVEGVSLLSERHRGHLSIKWYGEILDDSLAEAKIKIEKYKLNAIFEFYPPTINIHKIIAKADVVGLFSFYEGLPNAVCEGMACGKPIIGSRISDLSTFLPPESLFDPNDSISLKVVLEYFLSVEKDALLFMGAKNRNSAKKLFNPNAIINKYLNLMYK